MFDLTPRQSTFVSGFGLLVRCCGSVTACHCREPIETGVSRGRLEIRSTALVTIAALESERLRMSWSNRPSERQPPFESEGLVNLWKAPKPRNHYGWAKMPRLPRTVEPIDFEIDSRSS
jgi:hypothetical protein